MKTLIIVILIISSQAYAQWQPDVRLTNNTAGSYTSSNNAWCVAAVGNIVDAVWYDSRDGNNEIYFKRSTDAGVSWGADTRLTNNSAVSQFPSISVFGSTVHVVWQEERDGNQEIYYKRSTDGGVSWGADTRLTNQLAISRNPSLSVNTTFVHVVWEDFRHGNFEIFYKRSTDGGISWGVDVRLTNDLAGSFSSSVSVSGSNVHVVWWDERDGNPEIYYKRSTDGGVSWGADYRLTNNAAYSFVPCVSVSGSVVHVVWQDNRDGNFEIYDEYSTNSGVSWVGGGRLTNNSAESSYPSVSISGSFFHVVWRDNRDGNNEIYYKRSSDAGISWSTDLRLTNNSALSDYPSVFVYGSAVHVLWNDNRDGNNEIYYKRNPTGNIVGIKSNNSKIPKEFSLSQNYPNPFNPKTIIEYQLPISSYVRLTVYDIMGREIEVLVNERQNAGTYEVEFSATGGGTNYPRLSSGEAVGQASGVYFYKLIVTDASAPLNTSFVETKKMMLIK